ncbi:hypothetical protein E3N88_45858 [Mikania micrantha]|uniref:Uncharacterized protein n=1 Tax=Mikania micrantha TaxID=192012 RepID=A0A5N6L8K9_9ASTR|nr:hypothetical protein E3N88_45858 [Mikania micrantha]
MKDDIATLKTLMYGSPFRSNDQCGDSEYRPEYHVRFDDFRDGKEPEDVPKYSVTDMPKEIATSDGTLPGVVRVLESDALEVPYEKHDGEIQIIEAQQVLMDGYPKYNLEISTNSSDTSQFSLLSKVMSASPAESEVQILVPGGGYFRLFKQLSDDGFRCLPNIDFSKVVIGDMLKHNNVCSYPCMRWRVMDMTSVHFADKSFALTSQQIVDNEIDDKVDGQLGEGSQKQTGENGNKKFNSFSKSKNKGTRKRNDTTPIAHLLILKDQGIDRQRQLIIMHCWVHETGRPPMELLIAWRKRLGAYLVSPAMGAHVVMYIAKMKGKFIFIFVIDNWLVLDDHQFLYEQKLRIHVCRCSKSGLPPMDVERHSCHGGYGFSRIWSKGEDHIRETLLGGDQVGTQHTLYTTKKRVGQPNWSERVIHYCFGKLLREGCQLVLDAHTAHCLREVHYLQDRILDWGKQDIILGSHVVWLFYTNHVNNQKDDLYVHGSITWKKRNVKMHGRKVLRRQELMEATKDTWLADSHGWLNKLGLYTMKPSAEGPSPQPLPPDKPPSVVEQVADHFQGVREQPDGEIETDKSHPMGEKEHTIADNTKKSDEEVVSDYQSSPRERSHCKKKQKVGLNLVNAGNNDKEAGTNPKDKQQVPTGPQAGNSSVSRGETGKDQKMQVDPSSTSGEAVGQGKHNPKRAAVQAKGNKNKGGFDVSRAVNGDRGKGKQNQFPGCKSLGTEDIPLGNRFSALDKSNEGDTASMSLDNMDETPVTVIEQCENNPIVLECPMNKEVDMDLGRILPDSILGSSSGAGSSVCNLSEYKKSVIMGYINGTKAVPALVANSWDEEQLNYFTDQCIRFGFAPDYLVVDNESFLEDNLLDVSSVQPLPENKRKAILKALNSNAKAVKAKHMVAWSVAEWVFFKVQVDKLGLDMTYAVEDVEDEVNGMAAFMAGQGCVYLSWKGCGGASLVHQYFMVFVGLVCFQMVVLGSCQAWPALGGILSDAGGFWGSPYMSVIRLSHSLMALLFPCGCGVAVEAGSGLVLLPPLLQVCFSSGAALLLTFGGVGPPWVFAKFFRGLCYLMWIGDRRVGDHVQMGCQVVSFGYGFCCWLSMPWFYSSCVICCLGLLEGLHYCRAVGWARGLLFSCGEGAGCWEVRFEPKTHPLHFGFLFFGSANELCKGLNSAYFHLGIASWSFAALGWPAVAVVAIFAFSAVAALAMDPSIGGFNPLISPPIRPPNEVNPTMVAQGTETTQEAPPSLSTKLPDFTHLGNQSSDSSFTPQEGGQSILSAHPCKSNEAYQNGEEVANPGGIRKERRTTRYSPLLSNMRIKEFIQESAVIDPNRCPVSMRNPTDLMQGDGKGVDATMEVQQVSAPHKPPQGRIEKPQNEQHTDEEVKGEIGGLGGRGHGDRKSGKEATAKEPEGLGSSLQGVVGP